MTEIANRIASDNEQLAAEYDIVIVGSGYGGAIMAARLGYANHIANAGLRIAVLERGAEHPTGTFPDTEAGVVSELNSSRNPTGLLCVDRFKSIDVLRAC